MQNRRAVFHWPRGAFALLFALGGCGSEFADGSLMRQPQPRDLAAPTAMHSVFETATSRSVPPVPKHADPILETRLEVEPPRQFAASAGVDQDVQSLGAVTLTAGTIGASPSQAVSYLWRQTQGPTVVLSNVGSAEVSFIAPYVSMPTELSFSLSASVNGQYVSSTVSVTVSPSGAASES